MKTLVLVLVFSFLIPIDARACDELKVPFHDYWMGIYLKGAKIGCMRTTTARTDLDGKNVLCWQQAFRVAIRGGDKCIAADFKNVIYATEDLTPLARAVENEYRERDDPQVYKLVMEFRYTPEREYVKVQRMQERKAFSEPTSEGDWQLHIDSFQYDFGVRELSVGDSFDVHHVGPLILKVSSEELGSSFAAADYSVKVLRRERVTVGDTLYDALVVVEKRKSKSEEITRWQLENGEMIKVEIPQHDLTYIREPKEKALDLPWPQYGTTAPRWLEPEPSTD